MENFRLIKKMQEKIMENVEGLRRNIEKKWCGEVKRKIREL